MRLGLDAAREAVDGLEAQRGGGVVAGAERLAGLDLDGRAVHGKARAVVAAVHDEAAGAIGGRAACDRATQFSSGTLSTVGVPRFARSPASACAIAASGGSASVVGLDDVRGRLVLEQRDRQRLGHDELAEQAGDGPARVEIGGRRCGA